MRGLRDVWMRFDLVMNRGLPFILTNVGVELLPGG